MNLQQLEYIIAVDRFKHFSKAADYCNVTQATLSAMIKKLEEELGQVIFDRKHTPVVTTDIGIDLIIHATQVLGQVEQLRETARSANHSIEGILKIGIIPTVATTLLPIILKPILKKFPKLKLEIQELTTLDLVEKLKLGILDIGILATPLNGKTEIEESILYYESMMVYGVGDSHEKYIKPEIIDREIVWLMEEGHCFREQSVEICNLKKKNNMPKNLLFEANSFETLVNLTDEFGGITMIPELYFQGMKEIRKNKTRPFNFPIPVREISLVYYRPYAKLSAIEKIAGEIKSLMKGRLSTEKNKAKDLSIIGF